MQERPEKRRNDVGVQQSGDTPAGMKPIGKTEKVGDLLMHTTWGEEDGGVQMHCFVSGPGLLSSKGIE